MFRTKTKRSIARAVFAFTMLFLIGIVGGVEHGNCSMREAVARLILGIIVLFLAGAKGGLYRRRENGKPNNQGEHLYKRKDC